MIGTVRASSSLLYNWIILIRRMGQMAEAEKQEHKCMRCGSTSYERALLPVEMNGEDKWVCAGCLPYLIHGGA